jgi:DNA-binding GntR family transcriptional regulator
MSFPEQAVRVSAVDRAIIAIKEGIHVGKFAPGQHLSEPELVQSLGVSRGSVREALRRLGSEGFLEQRPFSGATVRRMSKKEVLELSQIRGLLEGLAARLAAERITTAGKREFRALEHAYTRSQFDSYSEYNAVFHAFIIKTSGHPYLPTFLERTQLEILRLQFARVLQSNKAVQRSHSEHSNIFRAIMDGKADAAERAMRRHVKNSTAAILRAPDELFQPQ